MSIKRTQPAFRGKSIKNPLIKPNMGDADEGGRSGLAGSVLPGRLLDYYRCWFSLQVINSVPFPMEIIKSVLKQWPALIKFFSHSIKGAASAV